MERMPSDQAGEQKHGRSAASPCVTDSAPPMRKTGQLVANSSRQVAQAKVIERIQSGSLHAAESRVMDTIQCASTGAMKTSRSDGLPDSLRSNMEAMSGMALNDVRVHRNSDKPAQLNALAYAQGSDIYLGSGQEAHLPHEAWHVVQQRQGRVRPTVQIMGTNVNDDASLEREADVSGQMALRSTLKGGPVQRKAPSSSVVVQRAVGFEFETGWHVWDQTNIEIWRKSGGQGTPPDAKPLKKKDMVHDAAGFKVEADEAGAGQSELEFIIHPPIPTTPGGINSAMDRMVPVYLFGAKLLSGPSSGRFALDTVTGDANDKKFLIKPNDKTLTARPQVTAGISLQDIPKLSKAQKGVSLPSQIDNTHVSAENALDLERASQALPLGMEMDPSLHGLLMPIASYIDAGQRAVFYPKQIADRFLLARTDFAGLFRLLPREVQDHFKKNPMDFVRLGLAAAAVDDGDAPVLGRVWIDEMDMDRGVRPIGPSRAKWLFFITQGYDLLSGSHYKEYMGQYSDEGTGALAKELESMGELGKKAEPTRGEDKEGGIFELRSAALKGKHGTIPMIEWLPFVKQVLTYFGNLSKSD